MALLFLSTPERAEVWRRVFAEAGEQIFIGAEAVPDPAAITHIACWQPPANLACYPNLSLVISIGAGVDQIGALPQGLMLSRTVAPGIEEMVRDWIVMAALMLHRDMPLYLVQAARSTWCAQPTRPAHATRIGVMGLGRIGRLAAQSLAGLGFPVTGWSRSGNSVEDVEVFDAGRLDAFLGQADLLICTLPLTPETKGLMDATFFARLPYGARLVHAGRGAQLDMEALRVALDEGRLCAAMLDVTDPEPLPADHWAWTDPRVVITPHVASRTDAEEGARHALAVIRAGRDGRAIPGFVDQTRGY